MKQLDIYPFILIERMRTEGYYFEIACATHFDDVLCM